MWSPTHVNVIIRKAVNLLAKGKNETNNAFVVIELGKESYRTSIKEKVAANLIVWQEECEFRIPSSGNRVDVVITAFHRNSYGLDKFLGCAAIPLSSFDKNDNCTLWYKLRGKPGREKGKDKNRGEIEVTVQFFSKASHSLTDLSKRKESKSFASLLNIRRGDQILSFRELTRKASKGKGKVNEANEDGGANPSSNFDPGVVTDDEDEDEEDATMLTVGSISGNKSVSKTSLQSVTDPPAKPPRSPRTNVGTPPLERKHSNSCLDLREVAKSPPSDRKCLSSINLPQCAESQSGIFTKFSKKLKQFQSTEKKESNQSQKQTKSVLAQFSNKSREELITMIIELQRKVNRFHVYVMDLEDYLDSLLVKVMETSPTLLEKGSESFPR